MNILFFDTETTGFVKKEPVTSNKQPYTVQLAAVLADENGKRFHELNSILKCPVDIPTDSSDIHGITTEINEAFGLPAVVCLRMFYSMYQLADRVVCHNLAFDKKVMEICMHRYANGTQLPSKEEYCTMRKSTNIVNAKFADGKAGKFPKLEECYRHFFDTDFDNAHNAMADVHATMDVYYKLQAAA